MLATTTYFSSPSCGAAAQRGSWFLTSEVCINHTKTHHNQ